MPQTTLTMLIFSDGIDFTSIADDDGMTGSYGYFKGLFWEGELFRSIVILPEKESSWLETESVEDFSC